MGGAAGVNEGMTALEIQWKGFWLLDGPGGFWTVGVEIQSGT